MTNLSGYEIGNFISLKEGNLLKITRINPPLLSVVAESDNNIDIVNQSEVTPVLITPDILERAGFGKSYEKLERFHLKLSYCIFINGKEYYIIGVSYDNRYIWTCTGITFHYFHQIQNIFHIIEPTFEITLF